ncbi:MAG TPA: flavin reductase family protein, partial [Symbiobacteriaceae bacterium]|nr:flavin reductase family protein [Symbiobacteriaceae bacterium]
MLLDPASLPWRDAYKLMIGSILPRPIAWVSTVSKEGVFNLAPFSFFTVVAAEPMTICFSPMRHSNGGKKDTLINIEETGEFVVNIVSEPLAEAMNQTSAALAPEVDEFQVAGLTPVPSESVRVPRVGESLVAYECRLLQVVEVGEAQAGAGALVLGT